ncbi:hypothetical protein OESDEN_12372, partial [Oesophagostomum dentatum]
MRFLLVHYLISYSAAKTGFDGILGLQPSYSKNSFIDNLLKKGFVDNPLLTIWLSNRNISTEEPAGTITYGAIDAEHCSSEASVYTKMFTVYLMEYDEAANMYNVSCDAKFADFEIYIGNATLRIPSEQLILEMDDGRCVFAITRYEEELGGEPIYIGAPLYRQYCTIFDIRNQQIGFTAAVPTTPAPPTTSPVPSKPTTSSPMASSSTTIKQASSAHCKRIKKFDPNRSKSFKASSNYSEAYLSNFEATGYCGTDLVTLNHTARLSANNTRFLLAHHLESTAAVKSGFDGVLGLQPNLLHNSFIENIIRNGRLDKPLLTIWLSSRKVPTEEPAGTITYGAIDEAHCSSEILYTKMHTIYLIESNGFGLGSYSVAEPQFVEFTMEVWIRTKTEYADTIAKIVGAA